MIGGHDDHDGEHDDHDSDQDVDADEKDGELVIEYVKICQDLSIAVHIAQRY